MSATAVDVSSASAIAAALSLEASEPQASHFLEAMTLFRSHERKRICWPNWMLSSARVGTFAKFRDHKFRLRPEDSLESSAQVVD
jgi:hypothetical protein